ncbi:hypothetical protein AHiyo4_40350 [Arthrobacter sp. Hiyo4]|nr:hypothetical protein AHiyo4_40350 [Arthrobacter sp. Hiyo4]
MTAVLRGPPRRSCSAPASSPPCWPSSPEFSACTSWPAITPCTPRRRANTGPAASAGDMNNHKTTAPYAEPVALTTAAAAGHRGPEAVAAGPARCMCSADCASIQAMSAACTPSAQTGTLAAPEPAQGTRILDGHGGLPDPAGSSYAYVPGGPSRVSCPSAGRRTGHTAAPTAQPRHEASPTDASRHLQGCSPVHRPLAVEI